jgi:5-methylcytosine-specific restriction protein B
MVDGTNDLISFVPGQPPKSDWGLQGAIYPEPESEEEKGGVVGTRRSPIRAGENVIVYGAPGTGKSFHVDRELCSGVSPDSVFRTVFHRDYTYADFIGCYRPAIVGEGEGRLTYAFVPGPFARAVVKACTVPDSKVCLVIEEINRGNAAAIFGELFQLLDREASGQSEYGITPESSFLIYLEKTILKVGGSIQNVLQNDKFFLPANFSIYATMNSADQGVMPIDTAFKRRWRFEYLPVTFDRDAEASSWSVEYQSTSISWRHLCSAINNTLRERGVPEDRLVGQRFFKKEELQNRSVVGSKLLLYLWDDVLRHGDRRKWIFDTSKYKDFGSLLHAFDAGKAVFMDAVRIDIHSEDAQPTAHNPGSGAAVAPQEQAG